MSDDWRYPQHISTAQWRAMSIAERLRLSHEAFVKRRDSIFDRVRKEHPDWTESQIIYEALFQLYEGDIDPEFLRGAALAIARRAAERGATAFPTPGGVS